MSRSEREEKREEKKQRREQERGHRWHAGIFIGITLIIIGVVFLLKLLGVINFSIWEGFKTFWPVGIILAGIALVFKRRWLAFILILATVLIGALYVAERFQGGVYREVTLQNVAGKEVSSADLKLSYGAGELSIAKGSPDYIIVNRVSTNNIEDPVIKYSERGNNAEISIDKRGAQPGWHGNKESWNLELSPEIIYSISADYGAAQAELDLRDLKVKNLEINSGACESVITFGNYPTKASIDTGASSLTLKFPENEGVAISADTGLTTLDLNGFIKNGDMYYSKAYDKNKENIEVTISAGASEVITQFY